MIVTQKLQESFDNNRKEYPSDRLEYLISLGIDPQFAKQCEIMFEEVKASVGEVVAVLPEIKDGNQKIINLEKKATGKVIDFTNLAANDRKYGGIKKAA